MADDKDNGGGGGGGLGLGTGDTFLDAVGILLLFLVVYQLYLNLPDFLSSTFGELFGGGGGSGWQSFYDALYVMAVGFSAACFGGAIYAGLQLSRVRIAEKKELEELTRAAISSQGSVSNERWRQILSYAASDDHELWRLAIIEADVMLDEMMTAMGYTQPSLGEKLRSVERSDFITIDKAWEAHKVRNTIAHEGSNYDLTRREVQEAINNYRQVFREFEYV